MRRVILATWLSLLWLPGWLQAQQSSSPTCVGQFLNPITDICWSCILPLKIGDMSMLTDNQEENGTSGQAFCWCSAAETGVPKVGVSISFWEPARTVEVVRRPYCFPSLGGVKLDPGIDAPAHGRIGENGKRTPASFYQVHWYVNPVLYWLEILVDNPCLEQNVFDLAYFTEVDPLWSDSELTFVLNPEAALFTSPLAQAACAADCVAATSGFSMSELFWCAGCQGGMYPLNGWVATHIGGVQASSLLTQRFTNKMHREGLIWSASGKDGMCGYVMQPLMDKRNYKTSMTYPVRQTDKINGRCCQPFGRSTILWGAGKSYPYRGEDFAYMLFRKRDCCMGAF